MNSTFVAEAEQLSSSASSSYISTGASSPIQFAVEQLSDKGLPRSGDSASGATSTSPPTVLNVNRLNGSARIGMDKPNNSPGTRGATRYVDARNEKDIVGARAAAPALSGTVPSQGPPSPSRALYRTPPKDAVPAGENGKLKFGVDNAYAKYLVFNFFCCKVCSRPAADPVQLIPDGILLCRRCASERPSSSVVELPEQLFSAMRECIGSAGAMEAGAAEGLANRRFVQTKRDSGPAAEEADSARQNNTANVAAAGATNAMLKDLIDAERSERQQIETSEMTQRTELKRRTHTAPAKAAPRKASSGPSSREYKVEGDKKYEKAEYTAAVELYTKAINLQPTDGASNLKFLYGNRSAAYFMAQRYEDCINDCLAVAKEDPPALKMVARAARSASTMGDLKRAVEIMESVPREKMNGAMQAELSKYKSGFETQQRAERLFGTVEGNEQYRMLVAQYGDTVPFRIRLAESLMKQKQYTQAVETLEAISHSGRTPTACRVMGECLYMTGFEHFEAAKKCLRNAAQLDEECSALLNRIEIVDDGKQKGNSHFSKKNFQEAVSHYSSAIKEAAGNEQILRILYCNRAAANKELGKYREGVDDCTKALELDSQFFKAYARRARCHQHLGDHFAAVRDFKEALKFDSNDRELARELRAAEQGLAQEAEKEKDFYYQLNVTRTATDREIKLKYRELSLRWHPDKCVGLGSLEKERAEHKFKIISEAYGTLSDPAKRREYDMKSDRERFGRPGGFGGFSSTYSGGANDHYRGRPRAGTGGFW